MVSKFGPQHNGPKGKYNTWKFRFKNQNLRVARASRNSTPSEHSTTAAYLISARSRGRKLNPGEWELETNPYESPLEQMVFLETRSGDAC
jgi:hypothetical protein